MTDVPLREGASFNNLLDALDSSFCTFEGGDDPNQDGIYPDPFNTTDSFEGSYSYVLPTPWSSLLIESVLGPAACGTLKPAFVISTSYSYNEADLTPFYTARQCAEYAKVGALRRLCMLVRLTNALSSV